jgi:hypothetical protein
VCGKRPERQADEGIIMLARIVKKGEVHRGCDIVEGWFSANHLGKIVCIDSIPH